MLRIYKSLSPTWFRMQEGNNIWLHSPYDCLIISNYSDSYVFKGIDQVCIRVLCHHDTAEQMVADGILERIV